MKIWIRNLRGALAVWAISRALMDLCPKYWRVEIAQWSIEHANLVLRLERGNQ